MSVFGDAEFVKKVKEGFVCVAVNQHHHRRRKDLEYDPPQKNLEWLRPFTALGTTAAGDQRNGRFLTQALDPAVAGRLSRLSLCRSGWGMNWEWLPSQGTAPGGGLIAACGDPRQGDIWWFLHTDGLYSSPDGGATLHKVLDASGRVDDQGCRR